MEVDTPINRPIHVDVPQGGPEWHAWRAKIPLTGSRMPGICGLNYFQNGRPYDIFRLVRGELPEVQSNAAMEHGNFREPDARRRYSAAIGAWEVLEAGGYQHADPQLRDKYGVSIDGAVHYQEYTAALAKEKNDPILGASHLVEIKVPYRRNYTGLKPEYLCQMQYQMFVTGLPYNDNAVVFYGDQSKGEQLAAPILNVWRVQRNEHYIAWMCQKAEIFLKALESASDQHFTEHTFPLKRVSKKNPRMCPPYVETTEPLMNYYAGGAGSDVMGLDPLPGMDDFGLPEVKEVEDEKKESIPIYSALKRRKYTLYDKKTRK